MPIEEQTYTGHAIEPALTIMDGDLIVPADNYDVEYTNNVIETTDKDLALVDVTFKGNYTGSAQTTFAIKFKEEDKQINVDFGANDEWTTYYSPIDLTLPQGLKAYVVTGRKGGNALDLKTEEVTFIPKNVGVLLQRTDKTLKEFVGKTMSSYTVLEGVTPDADLFRGTASGIADLKTIDGIKYILLNDRFIQVFDGELPANRCYVYISNDMADGINHIDGDDANGIVVLQEGTNNKNAGTVIVSDVADGHKTITVTPVKVLYATKDEIKVVRSIKNPGQASARQRVPSIENTPVEVTPVDATADPSGTTKYTFEYDDDYNYQVTVNFQKRVDLSDRNSSNPVVILMEDDIKNLEYDGKAKTPRVEKVTCNGIAVDSSNYTVTYENNTNAGRPRVIITGQRFLMGATHAEFSISKRDFSHVTIEEPLPDQVYTGSPIIPNNLVITDIVDSVNIVNETDYELICEDNVEVGTAKVTVKPVNNYYGSWRDFYFNIIPASGINQIAIDDPEGQWFDVNGHRLLSRPTKEGVYVFRDKKQRRIKVHIK